MALGLVLLAPGVAEATCEAAFSRTQHIAGWLLALAATLAGDVDIAE